MMILDDGENGFSEKAKSQLQNPLNEKHFEQQQGWHGICFEQKIHDEHIKYDLRQQQYNSRRVASLFLIFDLCHNKQAQS